MTTMPPRELVGYALYMWDVTADTDPCDRTTVDYLKVAGLIIGTGLATLDDTWVLVDRVSMLDRLTDERRKRSDYLAMADQVLGEL